MDKEISPFISIVIICYNYGHLLPRALGVIARQTFRDFELVFVDNGSKDDSVEVLEQWRAEHPDIPVTLVTVKQNQGPAHGDNVGAAAAKGKYLLFHDADDWMDDNTLEVLAKAAKENDADRVISSFRDVNDDDKVVKTRSVGEKPVMWLHTMQQANLFRTEIYHKNDIQLECYWLDAEKTMRFSQHVKRVAFVHEPCYNYLVHTDSFSRKNLYKRINNPNESLDLLLGKFRRVYDALEDGEARDWQEYQTIRTYFTYLLRYLQDAPLKLKWQEYDRLHAIMKKYYPRYLKNAKLSLFRKEGDSFASRAVFWGLTLLERLHLMKLGLVFYHLITRIKPMNIC